MPKACSAVALAGKPPDTSAVAMPDSPGRGRSGYRRGQCPAWASALCRQLVAFALHRPTARYIMIVAGCWHGSCSRRQRARGYSSARRRLSSDPSSFVASSDVEANGATDRSVIRATEDSGPGAKVPLALVEPLGGGLAAAAFDGVPAEAVLMSRVRFAAGGLSTNGLCTAA